MKCLGFCILFFGSIKLRPLETFVKNLLIIISIIMSIITEIIYYYYYYCY